MLYCTYFCFLFRTNISWKKRAFVCTYTAIGRGARLRSAMALTVYKPLWLNVFYFVHFSFRSFLFITDILKFYLYAARVTPNGPPTGIQTRKYYTYIIPIFNILLHLNI